MAKDRPLSLNLTFLNLILKLWILKHVLVTLDCLLKLEVLIFQLFKIIWLLILLDLVGVHLIMSSLLNSIQIIFKVQLVNLMNFFSLSLNVACIPSLVRDLGSPRSQSIIIFNFLNTLSLPSIRLIFVSRNLLLNYNWTRRSISWWFGLSLGIPKLLEEFGINLSLLLWLLRMQFDLFS